MIDFPRFFFDSNACFGYIDTYVRFAWLIINVMTAHDSTEDEAIAYILAAKRSVRPPRIDFAPLEAIVPSFGYRREHLGAGITLEAWLREQDTLDLELLHQSCLRYHRA